MDLPSLTRGVASSTHRKDLAVLFWALPDMVSDCVVAPHRAPQGGSQLGSDDGDVGGGRLTVVSHERPAGCNRVHTKNNEHCEEKSPYGQLKIDHRIYYIIILHHGQPLFIEDRWYGPTWVR